MNKDLAVIILAAGKGTRMKSALAKVMHLLCNRPMISYVLDLANSLKPKGVVTVLGHQSQEVRAIFPKGIKVAIQKKLIGTADAVKAALSFTGGSKNILILYGDIPLLKKATIEKILKNHAQGDVDATILTAKLEKPAGYGRVLRDKYAAICGIVEDKDANEFEKEIKEINTGIICFNLAKLKEAIKLVRPNNRKKEYYLTDVIGIFYKKGFVIEGVSIDDINEAMGINSRSDLAKANKIMQQRINENFMKDGVGIVDPTTTFISYGTKIGQDTTIYPFTVIERDVKIGKHCQVGPFAHLREGTTIGDTVVAGNFIEMVRTRVSENTFVKHFSYLGDAFVGKASNIGAGTVTANFDGTNKGNTVIGEGAFIGSDTVLVAPIKIGKGAKTGAGSVVTKNKNVPNGGVVVGVPARPIAIK